MNLRSLLGASRAPSLAMLVGCVSPCWGSHELRLAPYLPLDRFEDAVDGDGNLSEEACFELCIDHSPVWDVEERISCVVTDPEATRATSHFDTDLGTMVEGSKEVVELECVVQARILCY